MQVLLLELHTIIKYITSLEPTINIIDFISLIKSWPCRLQSLFRFRFWRPWKLRFFEPSIKHFQEAVGIRMIMNWAEMKRQILSLRTTAVAFLCMTWLVGTTEMWYYCLSTFEPETSGGGGWISFSMLHTSVNKQNYFNL